MVPLLATALRRAHVDAPVTTALHGLISGELPLDEWVATVRATVPPPAARDNAWRRAVSRMPAATRSPSRSSDRTDRQRRRGQLEHELGAAARGVDRAHAAAVLLGDLAHDRQPEPGARAARAPTRRGRSGRTGAAGPRRSTPAPWSRTRTPSTSTRTSTTPPGGEWRAALSSRLLTARASRSRVPSTTAGSSARLEAHARRVAARPGDRLGDELVEPHVLGLAPRLVAARELDQVGDEHAELGRLLLDVGQQPRALVGRQRLGLGQHLDVRAQAA